MLTERRRRAGIARGVGRDLHRLAHQSEPPDFGMVVLVDHVLSLDARVLHERGERLHRRGRNVMGREQREPLGAWLRSELLDQDRQELVAVFQTQEPGREARIVGQMLEPHRFRELRPEALVTAGEKEPLAVARLIEAVRRVVAGHHRLARIVDERAGV